MILRLSAALAASLATLVAFAMLLAACGSDGPQPAQPEQSQPTAYQAGESESRQQESQQTAADTRTDSQAQQTQESAPSASEQQQAEQQAEQVPVDTGTETSEQEAMVGRIIESGHRAGLFADRNSLGAPDAPIVITEFSDFL